MNKPFPTVKFFTYTLLALALFFGVNPALQLLGGESYRFSPEARAFSDKIVEFDDKHIAEITKTGSKPTMLHVYASWCPYCRQQSPIVMDLVTNNSAKMNVVMLSIDQNKMQLADFLSKKQQPLPYEPYILDPSASRTLMRMLQSQHSKFDGGIPYTAFFDTSGKMVADFLGVADKAQLDAGLEQAINHTSN